MAGQVFSLSFSIFRIFLKQKNVAEAISSHAADWIGGNYFVYTLSGDGSPF
jgi:hypothetical protein